MNLFGAFRSYLEAVDHDVIFAAFESGHQTVPLVLNESRLASQARGECIRQIYLESDDVRGIPWIGKRVGRSTFGVRGPDQLLCRRQRRSRQQEKQ